MSEQRSFSGGMRKLLSAFLVFSMLLCSLPLYINSAVDEGYDLPWLWPVPGSFAINGLDYYYSGNIHNQGQCIDISSNGYDGETRLDVVSATNGEVFYIRNVYNETTNKGSGWGNYVIVKSGNVCIIYAHLQSVTCDYGEIKAGDVIGKMGNTGNSTGVHLHVQAYPANESSSSTAIYAFDKYLYNPLYLEKFSFLSGLGQYSKRYGAHISRYYTASSGAYNTYSGGYGGDYGEKPLGAVVKSVRGSGARVYSQPITSSEVLKTFEFGTEITVYAYYTDAYGDKWYLISSGSTDMWIPESDVGFYSYNFGAQYVDKASPSGVYGAYSDLFFDGTVSVSHTIEKIRAEIKKGSTLIASCELPVGSGTFDINNVFSSAFGITELSDGKYTYEIFVTETASFDEADKQSKTYSVFTSEFTVDHSFSESIPPLVEDIRIAEMTPDSVSLSAVATDNKQILRVKYIIKNANGFEKSFSAVPNGNEYKITVPLSSLSGAGTYTVTAKAYDTNKNTDETSIEITFPVTAQYEVYQVKTTSSRLNLRSGPGTNYSQSGKLYNNDIITISEIVYNSSENRYWGNTGNGWCALEYTVYQSGYLYSVTFNLCGGTFDAPAVINKAFKVDVTIPDTVPIRNGYTFLGWATSPTSNQPSYQAGDVYSENSSVMLYAVWEDKTSPVINDVVSSVNGYAAEEVTLTVDATDNGDTLYYSFDGGLSWRRGNSIVITENQTIPSGAFMVKDPAGNVVSYNKEIVVSCIDNEPPVLDPKTLSTNVNGDSVEFIFGTATDALSGVSGYTVVYSLNSDFSDAVSVDASSPHTVIMPNGVYYAKLVISDNVGNECEIQFKRFLVGEPTKLDSPNGFTLSGVSSVKADFEWSPVPNADSYSVYVSEYEDFASSQVFTVSSESLTVTSLENGKVYYAKLVALSSDGMYLPSDATQVLRFETSNSDNNLYSFVSLSGVKLDGNTASAEIPYSLNTVDVTCRIHENATVAYYADPELKSPIANPSAFAFNTDLATVYIVITAENGASATYTLSLVRALRDAEEPIVDHTPLGGTLYIETEGQTLSLTANVNDGGRISVIWYVVRNGGEATQVAEGFTYTPFFSIAGNYSVYAVVTNTNDLCLNSEASVTTQVSEYTVLRNSTYIEAVTSDYVYDGTAPFPSYKSYVGDGVITYKFFADSECKNEIDPPVNAGKYYLKAYASQTDKYDSAESAPYEFSILRRQNNKDLTYVLLQPTLRDRFGKLTVSSVGVEYSINGSDYSPVEAEKTYTFNEGDIIEIRYKETDNESASVPITLTVEVFSGTDGFYPDTTLSATESGEYLLVNDHRLTAAALISKLLKQDDIYIHSPSGEPLNNSDGYIYSGCTISIIDDIGVYKTLTIIILGDLDYDGAVTDADVRSIMMLSNGMSAPKTSLDNVTADLDRDGEVTSIDASIAYQKNK